MPPDHGAAAVRIILEDDALRADWKAELEDMRLRMLNLRKGFAEALRRQSNSDRFDFIADHRGMFSRLGLTEAQVDRLRDEYGIYMVGDSRFNVAGLPEDGWTNSPRRSFRCSTDYRARDRGSMPALWTMRPRRPTALAARPDAR